MLLLCVIACAVAQARALALPPQCHDTGTTKHRLIRCEAESYINIDVDEDLFITVTCEGSNITCGSLPRLKLARSKATIMIFNTCHPNITSCMLEAFSVTHISTLALWHPCSDLEPHHVAGLKRLNGLNHFELIGDGKSLDYLRFLNMSFANMKRLMSSLFGPPPPRLKITHCEENRLNVINKGVFIGEKLVEVSTSGNRVNLTFGSRAFANLTSLKTLRMSNTRIVEIADDFMEGTFVTKLWLDHNEISEIPIGLLSDQPKLKDLDLSFNRIHRLPERAFSKLIQLAYLNLNNNFIQFLPGNVFPRWANMRSFSMDNNQLHTVSTLTFAGTTVSMISLNGNRLTLQNFVSSSISPFQPSSTTELRLANNSISHIFDDWKNTMPHLKILDLSGNNFTKLADKDLEFNKKGIRIDLRHNKISSIFISTKATAPQTQLYASQKTANTFLLDENPFHCDCQLYALKQLQYIGMTELLVLNLENATCAAPPNMKGRLVEKVSSEELTCDLQYPYCPESCSCKEKTYFKVFEVVCERMPTNWPQNIKAAEIHLKLHTPEVKYVPPMITSLDLSNTSLKRVDFSFNSTLKYLNLTNNELTAVPRSCLNSHLNLYLKDNPFICECSNKGDIQELLKFQGMVKDYQNVTCVDGRQIGLDVENLCYTEYVATIVCGSILLIVLTITVGLIINHYSHEILVFIISKGYCSCLFAAEYIDADKEYDIFVSFAHQDHAFVAEQLIPKLENEFKQKVCVHFRDWVVGDLIPMQIVRSAEQSRKTLIVLSRHFLSSMWATLEFRAAHCLALREGRARVVLVVLEDEVLADERLNDELRAYMATNTYLKSDDARFWERLRKALPAREHEFKVFSKIWGRRAARNDVRDPSDAGLDGQRRSEGRLNNDARIEDVV